VNRAVPLEEPFGSSLSSWLSGNVAVAFRSWRIWSAMRTWGPTVPARASGGDGGEVVVELQHG
jgi:hypothetical protein